MEWTEVRIDPVTIRINPSGLYVILWSYYKLPDWFFGIKILKENEEGKWNVIVEAQCPCSGSMLRDRHLTVPKTNRITVFCEDCKEPIFRGTGFLKENWSMEIPDK